MPQAAAYLRKSRSDDAAHEISREVQEQAVRELAAQDGHADLQLFIDWDRSGDDAKVERRAAYQALLRALKGREVGSIYAYSVDRLYRGLATFHALTSTAEAAGVRIVTVREGVVGGDGSPMARAYAQISAVFAELELNTAKARAKAASAARRRRGDYLGHPPYGYRLEKDGDGVVRLAQRTDQPIPPVLDAWERSRRRPRTAVRILNDELKIPAAHGGLWDRTSILRLVAREAPDRLPRRAPSGRREEPATPVALAKLLRCACGRTLTPNVVHERRRGNETSSVNYYCARGHASRMGHPRVYVAESRLLPWLKTEAARLRVPTSVAISEDDHAERARLTARRERVVEAFIDGLIDKTERNLRLAALEVELDRLEGRTTVADLPSEIDWEWAPSQLNVVLRELWRFIQLDELMRPVQAEWLVPEWRAGSGIEAEVQAN